MIGLTKRQHDLLRFIQGFMAEHDGVAPSFDEMKEALGLASKSGVHRLVSALEERGFLRRHYHRARAMEVRDVPLSPPEPSYKIPTEGQIAKLPDDQLWELDRRVMNELRHRRNESVLKQQIAGVAA